MRAVRQAAAVGHRDYIAYQARLLQAENQRIAAQRSAGAAQMSGMAPAHWRRPATEYATPSQAGTGATSQNRTDRVQAVDRHTWKQDPSPPMDPRYMTEAEARAALAAVNGEIADYNARCGRDFVLPNEKAAYDACVAAKGPLDARQAAIKARLKDLGIPIEGEKSAPAAPEEPPVPQEV